jgi:alkanesulfonate monooxygenase SsuD/methylene tetrahydromethanopterin reductase-like flavin-dependent oxidoreductase (luciferase family)
VLALSRLGEELGYDSISFYDHLYSLDSENQFCLETWSVLSALAPNSTKAKLLPLVTNNLFRHPGILAKIAATVDNLSKGRLIFGIGAGCYEKEAIDLGYTFPNAKTRIEMLEESIQVISKLWSEDKTTFKGRYYTLEKAESLPKPFQKPHPPILIGGKGRRLLHLVAKYADISNFTLRGSKPKDCEDRLSILKDYCSEEGRDYNSISKTISGLCFFADTQSELESDLESEAKRRETPKEEVRQFFESSAIFGTVDEVIEQIKEYERIGIDGAMFRFFKAKQGEKAKSFTEMILPKIRK